MEEVWKDINLESLPHDTSNHTLSDFALHNLVLHNFLITPPFNRHSPPYKPFTPTFSNPSSTKLNLNSGTNIDQHLEGNRMGLSSHGNKRVQEDHYDSGDRRHKRLIKNRESAARSRARKRAYRNKLENEVVHLKAENARLRRQQEMFCLTAAEDQLPRRHTLYRTSTAPF